MSEEEKEAIEELKDLILQSREMYEEEFYKFANIHNIQNISTCLNLISKLQKENKDLELAYGLYKDTADKLQKENEEYHRIKKELIRVNKKIYDVDTIDEFIETIDKLQKVIDLMATELSRRPLMIYLDDERDDRLAILDNPKKIIKYYTKKVEEEK